ncbi:MAG: ATP-binding cassette domain-containing protein [Desulfomonilia bacterium]|uniref:Energy-coupling factor transporter ATP-binding protein EcfA1 n=1 Tax=anaerobic digester metagenome TaxID=1263854 RepID=A0A485LWS4_9ZZZZ
MQPAVRIRNASFSYRTKSVLRGIDMEVPRGSYFGVVGPNGSGKTTLAYLISGILSPDEGEVDTFGNRVGLILANPANQVVSPVVEEDIAFGPENLALEPSEITARIDAALHAVRGEGLRGSLTTALSGGELAKVVFAGQLALDTDVLVLDEGTIMLDPLNRATLLRTVHELNRDLGKTVIHISHRLDDLENARSLVVLDKGTIGIRAQGVPDLVRQIKEHPVNGIEPGAHTLYRSFLLEQGIEEQDLEKATRRLAAGIRQGSLPQS